ncbi:uncharacterized protein F5147DRAFT_779753 [Suillus discolor]|uniref:Uncharacterized protein n=1 Tax=Suillus discolor TaxID=1912936 RepID=A0A9P7JMY5_9AGAM|nr:uncharacterized protein F5147DRAFT_779753 [Suillus discolor]KAG2092130.1 hypothetical protein F5147DRAFT_779753 [Suillus discolor]
MKSLKSHSAAYIDKSNRASIGGYSLQSKPPATIANYINGLTGLTAYNSVASLIDFTRDTNGRAYHRLPILILIAQRLLRPVDNSCDTSLLDLFFDDYKEIPEQLISVICAMYVVMFKCRLVLQPRVLHSVDVREEAVCQLHLLRIVRRSSGDEAVELNAWITTCDGQHGWLAALQNALTLANGLQGLLGRSSELA